MKKKGSIKNLVIRKSASKKRMPKENKKIKSLSKIEKLSPKKLEKYLSNFLKKFQKESTDEKQRAIMENFFQRKKNNKIQPAGKRKSEKYIHNQFRKDFPHLLIPEYKCKSRKRNRFNANWSEFKCRFDEKMGGEKRTNKSMGLSRMKGRAKDNVISNSWFKHLRQISKANDMPRKEKSRAKAKKSGSRHKSRKKMQDFSKKKKQKDSNLSYKENWDSQIPLINQSNQEYMHRRNMINQTLATSGLLSTDFDLRQSHRVDGGEDIAYKLPQKSLQGLPKKQGLHPKIAQMRKAMLREVEGSHEDSAVSVSFSESAGMQEIMEIYERSIKDLLSESVDYHKTLIQSLKKEKGGDGQLREIKTSMHMYRVIKLLGKGSFGRVYLALQKLTNRLVAIKSLAKTAFNDSGLKQKIQGEVKMMKTLTGHPFIISLLEVFENSRYVFFVTEYAANRDLLRALKKHSNSFCLLNSQHVFQSQMLRGCSSK